MVSRRRFNLEKDYDIIGRWWRKHGSYIPAPEYLSQTGLIIEIDNEPVAAGFLYKTDSAICVFEWVVVNPETEKESRDKALDYLIESAIEWSEKAGFKVIYSSLKEKKFIKRLEAKSFVKCDENQTHMFYGVEQ